MNCCGGLEDAIRMIDFKLVLMENAKGLNVPMTRARHEL